MRLIDADAITFDEVFSVKQRVRVGDRFPVACIDEFEEGTRRKRIRVGRVISKHRNLVCLSTGTSITYVQICQYFRAIAADPTKKHYIS